MPYNLTFWPTPDWQRESSLDPRFRAAMIACLVLLIGLGAVSWSYYQLQQKRQELAQLTQQNHNLQKDADEVRRQIDCTARWNDVMTKLSHKTRVRIPWSCQLEDIQSLISDRTVLGHLQLRSQRLEIALAKAADEAAKTEEGAEKKEEAPRATKATKVMTIQSELTMRGVAKGEDANEQIALFSRALERHPEMGPLLDFAKLKGVAPDTNPEDKVPGKQFTILCRFKPIRWFDEPTDKKTAK